MFIEKLLNLIYPPVCGFCNIINKNFICENCKRKYDELKITNIENYENEPVYFDEHMYLYKYEKEVRKSIIKYKFDEKSYMYKSFAKLIIEDDIFRNEFINKYDIVTSVPIHKKRYKYRGYNQSELIAKELANVCEKQYHNRILEKCKNIVAQSSLDKLERVKNIKNAFALGSNAEKVKGKNVLIFDDVFTTGATANECARLLKEAGASFVGIITIAKS